MAMTDSAFDALAVARDLETAGFERREAHAVAGAIRDGRAGLATKADIRRLEEKMTAFEDKMATKADLAALENRMLRVAIGIVLAQTALTAALTAGLTFGLLKMFGGGP